MWKFCFEKSATLVCCPFFLSPDLELTGFQISSKACFLLPVACWMLSVTLCLFFSFSSLILLVFTPPVGFLLKQLTALLFPINYISAYSFCLPSPSSLLTVCPALMIGYKHTVYGSGSQPVVCEVHVRGLWGIEGRKSLVFSSSQLSGLGKRQLYFLCA